MKVLAVDTATQSCGVALSEKDRLLAEMLLVSRETHSIHLMGMVRDVLARTKVSLAEVDAFAVTLGPGSFTGLRIGISTIKGLAAAMGKPLAGISTLEALAWQYPSTGTPVAALMDARRREVYAARFRFEAGELIRETADQVGAPMEAVQGISEPCLFAGSGALLYRQIILQALGDKAFFVPAAQNYVRPSSVAVLGYQRLSRGTVTPLDKIVPIYIRKSDAEMNLNLAAGRRH